MAFFKFRPGVQTGPEESASGADTRTIDQLRRKARQRLMGAAVLVVLAVAGFPLVFDTQPRPVSVDLAIDIPSKTKTSPETPPAPLASSSGQPNPVAATDAEGKHGLGDKEELVSVAAPPAEPAKDLAIVPAPEAAQNAAKAAAAEPRYVVQVGAFLEDAKVRETRSKLEKAGLKTYTQVVEAKDGKRTRVRLGPFGSKSEAESAAEKAKALQLQAIILSY